MGFKYKVDKSNNILFVHFTGVLDDKSLLATFNRVFTDHEYSPVMNQCINYSDILELSISRFGIEALVNIYENFACLNTKWNTYIIAPDDLMYGYGRMYQLLREGSNEEIHVVRSMDAAIKLMAISPDDYPFPKEELDQSY